MTRFLSSVLFDVRPRHPITYVVSATLLDDALLATWLPARRATSVDPMIALRTE